MVMTDSNLFFGFIKSITRVVLDKSLKIDIINKAEEMHPGYKFCNMEICNALEYAKAYVEDGQSRQEAITNAVKEMYKKPQLEQLDFTDSPDSAYNKFWGKIFSAIAIVFAIGTILILAFLASCVFG